MTGRAKAIALLSALALGVLLRLPYLDSDFRRDDHVMLALLQGEFTIDRAGHDLYWFSGRDATETRALRDSGYLPWWTAPDYRLAFFRPLSSISLWLDYRLFGAQPRPFQLHSFAWFGLWLSAAALVLRRVLPAGAATLALFFVAVDEAYAGPLGWPSNRTALISGSLGLLALWTHLRARQDGDRRAALAAPALAAASLLGGEYALSVLSYVVAYEFFGARGPLKQRLGALAPIAGVSLVYLIARNALGYGSRASGLYIGPLESPLRFVISAVQRIPVLASDLFLGVPALWAHQGSPWRNELLRLQLVDRATWQALPSWQSIQVTVGVLALGGALWLGRALYRWDGEQASALRWLLPGALLSLIASSGAVPSSRLLLAAELAAATLLAVSLSVGLARLRARQGAVKVVGLLGLSAIVLIHGALAMRHSATHARDYRVRAEACARWALSAELPADARGRDIFVLSAADLVSATYAPYIRARAGYKLPRSYHRLGNSSYPQRLRRLDAHTLDLIALAAWRPGSLERAAESPLQPGERIRVASFSVEVIHAQEGSPLHLRFRFDRPLDDDSMVFLSTTPGGLRRQPLPAIGEELLLPFASLPWPADASTFL